MINEAKRSLIHLVSPLVIKSSAIRAGTPLRGRLPRTLGVTELTSGDDINIVASLKVHLEELFSDTFRNGPIVILFVEPIPKLATERGVNSA